MSSSKSSLEDRLDRDDVKRARRDDPKGEPALPSPKKRKAKKTAIQKRRRLERVEKAKRAKPNATRSSEEGQNDRSKRKLLRKEAHKEKKKKQKELVQLSSAAGPDLVRIIRKLVNDVHHNDLKNMFTSAFNFLSDDESMKADTEEGTEVDHAEKKKKKKDAPEGLEEATSGDADAAVAFFLKHEEEIKEYLASETAENQLTRPEFRAGDRVELASIPYGHVLASYHSAYVDSLDALQEFATVVLASIGRRMAARVGANDPDQLDVERPKFWGRLQRFLRDFCNAGVWTVDAGDEERKNALHWIAMVQLSGERDERMREDWRSVRADVSAFFETTRMGLIAHTTDTRVRAYDVVGQALREINVMSRRLPFTLKSLFSGLIGLAGASTHRAANQLARWLVNKTFGRVLLATDKKFAALLDAAAAAGKAVGEIVKCVILASNVSTAVRNVDGVLKRAPAAAARVPKDVDPVVWLCERLRNDRRVSFDRALRILLSCTADSQDQGDVEDEDEEDEFDKSVRDAFAWLLRNDTPESRLQWPEELRDAKLPALMTKWAADELTVESQMALLLVAETLADGDDEVFVRDDDSKKKLLPRMLAAAVADVVEARDLPDAQCAAIGHVVKMFDALAPLAANGGVWLGTLTAERTQIDTLEQQAHAEFADLAGDGVERSRILLLACTLNGLHEQARLPSTLAVYATNGMVSHGNCFGNGSRVRAWAPRRSAGLETMVLANASSVAEYVLTGVRNKGGAIDKAHTALFGTDDVGVRLFDAKRFFWKPFLDGSGGHVAYEHHNAAQFNSGSLQRLTKPVVASLTFLRRLLVLLLPRYPKVKANKAWFTPAKPKKKKKSVLDSAPEPVVEAEGAPLTDLVQALQHKDAQNTALENVLRARVASDDQVVYALDVGTSHTGVCEVMDGGTYKKGDVHYPRLLTRKSAWNASNVVQRRDLQQANTNFVVKGADDMLLRDASPYGSALTPWSQTLCSNATSMPPLRAKINLIHEPSKNESANKAANAVFDVMQTLFATDESVDAVPVVNLVVGNAAMQRHFAESPIATHASFESLDCVRWASSADQRESIFLNGPVVCVPDCIGVAITSDMVFSQYLMVVLAIARVLPEGGSETMATLASRLSRLELPEPIKLDDATTLSTFLSLPIPRSHLASKAVWRVRAEHLSRVFWQTRPVRNWTPKPSASVVNGRLPRGQGEILKERTAAWAKDAIAAWAAASLDQRRAHICLPREDILREIANDKHALLKFDGKNIALKEQVDDCLLPRNRGKWERSEKKGGKPMRDLVMALTSRQFAAKSQGISAQHTDELRRRHTRGDLPYWRMIRPLLMCKRSTDAAKERFEKQGLPVPLHMTVWDVLQSVTFVLHIDFLPHNVFATSRHGTGLKSGSGSRSPALSFARFLFKIGVPPNTDPNTDNYDVRRVFRQREERTSIVSPYTLKSKDWVALPVEGQHRNAKLINCDSDSPLTRMVTLTADDKAKATQLYNNKVAKVKEVQGEVGEELDAAIWRDATLRVKLDKYRKENTVVLIQRDIAAAIVQARALLDLSKGEERHKELCFKSALALRAAWAVSRKSTTAVSDIAEWALSKKYSASTTARALFGCDGWREAVEACRRGNEVSFVSPPCPVNED